MLGQALVNLLDNAMKYTPRGGAITVSVARSPDLVTITVEDTGIGIPPGDLPRVFSRLYRADNALIQGVGDTGVGLSIVKALVEAHGGAITADSEGKGCGCVFTISLPLGS